MHKAEKYMIKNSIFILKYFFLLMLYKMHIYKRNVDQVWTSDSVERFNLLNQSIAMIISSRVRSFESMTTNNVLQTFSLEKN